MANQRLNFWSRMVDGLGVQGGPSSPLSLPDSVTIAELVAALGDWAAAVDGCTDVAFAEAAITITPALPAGLKSATGATWLASRMEQSGILDFGVSGQSRRHGQVVPGFSSALITGGKIDVSAPAVATLAALLTGPVLGGSYTDSAGGNLVGLLAALLSFRKYREQLAELTLEA